MSKIECFLLEPTMRSRVSLRRYSSSGDMKVCQGVGYHNAKTPIGERAVVFSVKHAGCIELIDRSEPPRADPRWPTRCEACGYEFVESDAWQLFSDLVYVRRDTGAEMTLHDAPPGAMWDATWWPDRGPDGRTLCVRLPPGRPYDDWMIDGPSNNGGGWTRTGVAPRITARPSILTKDYHGFLTDGFLESC